MLNPSLPECHTRFPGVSVVITTYNHQRYIEQAIQSVLAQETSFPIEILIADDCSKDRTPEIIAQLDKQNPGRLTVLKNPRNLGISGNLQSCREQARGRYMAILEGDDYWIDTRKLQKQFDAMEANPDWSMCYTGSRVFTDDGSKPDLIKPRQAPDHPLSVDDFLEENAVQTMSVGMYRQGVIERTPDWHAKVRIGDWALHILHAYQGPVGFVPGVMTAYRVHAGGMWSGWDTFRQWMEMVNLFSYLEQHFRAAAQDDHTADKMAKTREYLTKQFADRVKDLEKVERRYLALHLDKIAAVIRKIKHVFIHR